MRSSDTGPRYAGRQRQPLRFEVFGPNAHSAVRSCPVFAFEVESIESARKEMEEKGAEFVTEIQSGEDEAWCHFRGPDGVLYEIKQTGLDKA